MIGAALQLPPEEEAATFLWTPLAVDEEHWLGLVTPVNPPGPKQVWLFPQSSGRLPRLRAFLGSLGPSG